MEFFFPLILRCVLKHFDDENPIVVFHTIESVYNIAKASSVHTLPHLTEIFRGFIRAISISNSDIRRAGNELDQLLKSIVVESNLEDPRFDINTFMQCTCELFRSSHSKNARNTLLSWIVALQTIPLFDVLAYLPSFMGYVFEMLADTKEGNTEAR
jgi:hypothetical protein